MKYKVRVRDGMCHGKDNQHVGGDVIIVTEAEVTSFRDKFTDIRPYEEEDPFEDFDLATASPEEVIAAVEAGAVSAKAAILEFKSRAEAEKAIADPSPLRPPAKDDDFDLATASVDDILAAVEAGVITAETAVEAELQRPRPRKTIMRLLEETEA